MLRSIRHKVRAAERLSQLNAHLRSQNTSLSLNREGGRSHKALLLVTLNAIKKDNQRIRQEIVREKVRTDGEGAARGSQRQRPRSSMGAQQAAASAGRDASITEDQALAAGLCGSIRCVGGAPGRQGTTGAAATSTTEIQRYRTVGKRLRAILATERRLHASISDQVLAQRATQTELERQLAHSYASVLTEGAQSCDHVQGALPVEIPRRRLSRQQRDQVLEHLLGQDSVLQLLYG